MIGPIQHERMPIVLARFREELVGRLAGLKQDFGVPFLGAGEAAMDDGLLIREPLEQLFKALLGIRQFGVRGCGQLRVLRPLAVADLSGPLGRRLVGVADRGVDAASRLVDLNGREANREVARQ